MRICQTWISPSALKALLAAAPGSDRREPCGVLLGYRVPLGAEIVDAVAVPNAHPSGEHAFLMEPQGILTAARAGRARGLDIVGFWHSHPDGPAWPGAFDDEGMQSTRIEGLPPHVHIIVGRGTVGRRVVRAFREGRHRPKPVALTLLRRARGRSAAAAAST
jgi:proteasome lid subunit RPN8/RPN11